MFDSGFLLRAAQVRGGGCIYAALRKLCVTFALLCLIRVSAFPKKAAAKPKKQAIVISEDEDDSSPSKSQSKSKKSRDYSSDEDNSEVIIDVVHVLVHKAVITFAPFFVI